MYFGHTDWLICEDYGPRRLAVIGKYFHSCILCWLCSCSTPTHVHSCWLDQELCQWKTTWIINKRKVCKWILIYDWQLSHSGIVVCRDKGMPDQILTRCQSLNTRTNVITRIYTLHCVYYFVFLFEIFKPRVILTSLVSAYTTCFFLI